jgi:LysR family glycine cleavage system transcriptional activator
MRRLPPLTMLRTFEAVARLGSFRSAAEELAVTPTAVSHQIKALEDHCGVRLFERHPRPVRLTSAGGRLFPAIRDGMDLFSSALADLRVSAVSASKLRVSTTNAFAAKCLVPLLPAFHRLHPGIELELIGTDAVVDLQAGHADVSVRYARDVPTDGVAQELTRDRFHVVASKSLVASNRTQAWQRLPRIAYDWLPGDRLAPTWERWDLLAGTRARDKPRVITRFREELHALEAVVAGQGVAVCSDLLLHQELADGRVVRLSEVTLDGYGSYLVYLPDKAASAAVTTFSRWMKEVLSSRPAGPRTLGVLMDVPGGSKAATIKTK